MQHRRSSTDPPSAPSVSFQLPMHRTPSSRGGGGYGGMAATSETEDARTMTTMTTTQTTTEDTSCALDSTAAMEGRLLVDRNNSRISDNKIFNGDESGYGSDSSPDGAPNEEDLTDSSSGEGGSCRNRLFGDDDCDNDTSDGSEDSMRERIYFLREKQLIMERAGNVLNRRAERNYAAAVASDLCHGLTTESSSSASSNSSSGEDENDDQDTGLKKKNMTKNRSSNIWIEAKRVLIEMNKKGGGGGDDDDDSGSAFPVPTSIYRKRCAPTPIHPLIDTRVVQRIRSKLYDDASSETGTAPALAGSPFASSNQWLTKALLWSSSSAARTTAPASLSSSMQGSWTVATDPFTYTSGLVPPPAVSLDDAFDLQDVINVSQEARVVTQSSPPFCIVHVNRAFLELADLPERDTLVGRPVESIFRVASFVDPAAASSTTKGPKDHPNGDSRPITNDRHLTGTVQVGRSRNHSQLYRLRVLPVVDRSRRRRLGNETASSSSASASFQCMSHVVIQVEPSLSAQAATTTTSDTTPDRPMSSMATSYGDRPSVPLRPPTTANTTNGCVSGRAGMIG